MRIEFAPLEIPDAGTLVVLAGAGGALGATATEIDRRTGGALKRALQLTGDSFKRGQTIELLYPGGLSLERLLVLGLGKPEEARPLELEGLGGSLVVKLRGLRVTGASVVVDEIAGLELPPARIAVLLASGACLRGYRFEKYHTQKSQDDEPDSEVGTLTFRLAEPDAAGGAWASVEAVAQGVAHARDLVSEPANVSDAGELRRGVPRAWHGGRPRGRDPGPGGTARARHAGAARRGAGQCARAAGRRSCVGTAAPAGAPPVALIGKGVCFDSGGLSLKPARRHGGHEVGHGRRRCGVRRDGGARPARRQGQRGRRAGSGREHALGHRPAAGRRRDRDVRPDDRGHQHRRRGAPRAGRRAVLRQGAVQAAGHGRPRDADRRDHRGARPRACRPVHA